MTKFRLSFMFGLVLLVAGGVASLAWADSRAAERIADGVRIGGIEVGGLTKGEAARRVWDRLHPRATQPVRVRVAGRVFTLPTRRAGVRLALPRAVDGAYEAGRDGHVLERGWRAITGGRVEHDEPVRPVVDRDRVRSFVARLHRAISRKPVDAELTLAVDRVRVSRARAGRRLADRRELEQRITHAFAAPRRDRSLRAGVERLKPDVTATELWRANATVVTVSRSDRRVRIFRGGELARDYRVAVGEPKYPTPLGKFAVQTMQKDPTWNVPESDWAGDLAGKTIPAGDPRNPLVARWIGFAGAVGFHGTESLGSLGRAASHGCIRMRESDVVDLFERVEIGTPVLVGA